MSRSQTIDVLNDADDMQRRLDWVLFTNENEHHGSISHWVPGDPLYSRPCSCLNCGEQWIRPMIQELSLELFSNYSLDGPHIQAPKARCQDCDVYWTGSEPCFVCGVEVPTSGHLNRWGYPSINEMLTMHNIRLDSEIDFWPSTPIIQEFVQYTQSDVQASFSLIAAAGRRMGETMAEILAGVMVEGARLIRASVQTEHVNGPITSPVVLGPCDGEMEPFVARGSRIMLTWVDELRDWEHITTPPNGIHLPRRLRTSDFQLPIEPPTFDVREQWWGWGEHGYRAPIANPTSINPTSINPTRQRRPRRI